MSTASTDVAPADPREEEILRAAFEVFTAKGFHRATMLDVATAARASKATLYSRFAGKAALFAALVAWGTRQGAAALEAIADDATLDPAAALERFAARLLAQMLQPEKVALLRIAVAEGARMPEVGAILSGYTREHGLRLGRVLVGRLVAKGVVEIADAEEFGHAFIGLLQGEWVTHALLGGAVAPTPEQIEAHARRAMRRLLRAFAPQG
ncbi:TetR/AcrR family transcriptional regulator [Phenylobacterium sp.]|jgi:TetR/AcrR family transcriptional regulator, mexJK operon transcriptional repressor|uniref:TetR/AcrR family transcriptional regulator n=1 Tax=Phenylobacterium sp. TaxID=1871053 RepID=UPI0012220041|nr:TetR/AcrR family transcriptional regulator [Phenylobacterium sp.]THD60318.1 MAG: TetR/AcrR family transcriptional regulator [Phenylobacterium sp.]